LVTDTRDAASKSWDADAITAQRLALLMQAGGSAPSANGVLVNDDMCDRKDGHATDHVSHQYLGSVGKTDNGIVAVTSLWADERHYRTFAPRSKRFVFRIDVRQFRHFILKT
jgi:SRSO17 transposase